MPSKPSEFNPQHHTARQHSKANDKFNSRTFDIRNFSECLTQLKEESTQLVYECPVCGGHRLTISKKSGAYQCWSGGCTAKEIRDTIAPPKRTRTTTHSVRVPPKSRTAQPLPVPIPPGTLALVRLSPRETPQPQPPEFLPKGVPPHALEVIYHYSDTQTIHRFGWQDETLPKKRGKTFRQRHINILGFPVWSKGAEIWEAYRIDEAIGAISEAQKNFPDCTPVLLMAEGESVVEAYRSIGIAAITLSGSSWGNQELKRLCQRLKQEAPGVVLGFSPDNDTPGAKKAAHVREACALGGVPFLLIDLLAIEPKLPDKGDVVDILTSMDTPEFIRRLEEELHASASQAKQKQSESNSCPDIPPDRFDPEAETNSRPDIPDSFDPDVEFNQFAYKNLYGDQPWICVDGQLYSWSINYYKERLDAIELKRCAEFCNGYMVWKKVGDDFKQTYPYAKPSCAKSLLEWAKMRLAVDPNLVNPPGLNCTNGVLQIEWDGKKASWELVDSHPSMYYTYEPLFPYNPDANPKESDRLLSCLDAPQQQVFLKTIAASLDLPIVRKYKGRLVRALLLKGQGANGKDTLREVVATMYGNQGITGATLSDFASYDQGRKFPLARTESSRVNWASENTNFNKLDQIQSLKAFITGDALSKERKGKDEREFVPKAIALFNCNDVPNLTGTQEAISGRYAILSFHKTFKEKADPTKGEIEAEPRFKYDPEFLRQEVVPAFLNRVLQALTDLIAEGIDYSCTQAALQDIQAENSHLFQFCRDTGLDYNPNGSLTAKQIWERLEQWYQDNGTLSYEETSNGKVKAVWCDQAKSSDKNVKGVNQVIGRLQQLFPKAKRFTHTSGEDKNRIALKGISFRINDTSPINEPGKAVEKESQAESRQLVRQLETTEPLPNRDCDSLGKAGKAISSFNGEKHSSITEGYGQGEEKHNLTTEGFSQSEERVDNEPDLPYLPNSSDLVGDTALPDGLLNALPEDQTALPLADIKALLLACQTLAELQEVKEIYGEVAVKKAYKQLSATEKAAIKAITNGTATQMAQPSQLQDKPARQGLKEGDLVRYIGDDPNWQKLYGDEELIVALIDPVEGVTCRCPHGGLTTWFSAGELRRLE